jgi:hypothetical protein
MGIEKKLSAKEYLKVKLLEIKQEAGSVRDLRGGRPQEIRGKQEGEGLEKKKGKKLVKHIVTS